MMMKTKNVIFVLLMLSIENLCGMEKNTEAQEELPVDVGKKAKLERVFCYSHTKSMTSKERKSLSFAAAYGVWSGGTLVELGTAPWIGSWMGSFGLGVGTTCMAVLGYACVPLVLAGSCGLGTYLCLGPCTKEDDDSAENDSR